MAQCGSASALGAEGRRFESGCPDHLNPNLINSLRQRVFGRPRDDSFRGTSSMFSTRQSASTAALGQRKAAGALVASSFGCRVAHGARAVERPRAPPSAAGHTSTCHACVELSDTPILLTHQIDGSPTTVPDQPLTSFRATQAWARERIRELAADTGKIRWSVHARERMVERGITDVDVLKVLRSGHIESDPVRSDQGDGWKVKVVRAHASGREIVVVTLILDRGFLRLVTIEWEDCQ